MEILTVKEAAAIIGVHISGVYHMIERGEINARKSRKFGKHATLFLRSEVDKAIEVRKDKAEQKRIKHAERLASKVKPPVPEGYITTIQAKDVLGVSKQRIHQLIDIGELEIEKNHCPALIAITEIEDFQRRRARKNNGYISLCNTAKMLGIPIDEVRDLATDGQLKAERACKTGTRMLVTEESIKQFQAKHSTYLPCH